MSASTSVCTERMSVNGGSTATSHAVEVGVVEREGELLHERDRLEVVEVHLPVARHERETASAMDQSSRTAIPGRRLPSRNSRRRTSTGGDVREAGLVDAEQADGGGGVAAADDGEPVDAGDRLGDRAGALGVRRHLEHAHRAVPDHGAGVGEALGEQRAAVGADVEAHPAVLDVVDRRRPCARRRRRTPWPRRRRPAARARRPRSSAVAMRPLTVSIWSASSRDEPTSCPARRGR